MRQRLFWKFYTYIFKSQTKNIKPYLHGDGYGFYFGTRNKKDFFLSLLSSYQSDVAITLISDEIRSQIDRREIDHSFRFLFPLGKEYWLRPVSAAPEYFVRSITEWTDAHPPGSKVWNDVETTAIRTINWIAGYHLFSDHPSLKNNFLNRFFNILYLHASWLDLFNKRRIPSAVEELTVLTARQIAGIMFLNYRTGKRWYDRSVQQIDDMIIRDDADPGQESFYPRIECYTISYIESKKLKISRRPEAWSKLHKMFKAAAAAKHTPAIHRRIFRYRIEDEVHLPEGLLPVGAILFNDPGIKQRYPHLSEDALWLLGAEGFELFRNI